MNSSVVLIQIAVVLIVVALVGYFVKKPKKMEKEVVADIQNAKVKREGVYTIPEEYNNVSLGVGSGIKFGFGFGIGLFFAGVFITIVLAVFFESVITSLILGRIH